MKALHGMCVLASLVMAAPMCVWPQPVLADENEQEEIVTLEQLPAAAQKILRRESAGGAIGKIEKKTREGRVIYEADLMMDGRKYEAKVTEGGILLKKELEDGAEHGDQARHNMWSFEQDKVGPVPKGWKVAETGGEGKLARWQVVEDKSAPSPGHVVAITANKNYGGTFNLLLAKGANYKDLKIEVMVKAVAGQDDQGGGPVWRARDANNYYICRWNPLEDNLSLYYVKKGRRRRLMTAKVKTDPAAWHKIGVEHKGSKIEVEFDGKKLIDLDDSTFTEPGMVGLWVKADGRSEFDNIKVVEAGEKGKSEDQDNNEDEHEQKLSLSDVPAKVLQAANKAVPGGEVKEVEKEGREGAVIYAVEKLVHGVTYDIKVTGDGTVKKIEKDDDNEGANSDDG